MGCPDRRQFGYSYRPGRSRSGSLLYFVPYKTRRSRGRRPAYADGIHFDFGIAFIKGQDAAGYIDADLFSVDFSQPVRASVGLRNSLGCRLRADVSLLCGAAAGFISTLTAKEAVPS